MKSRAEFEAKHKRKIAINEVGSNLNGIYVIKSKREYNGKTEDRLKRRTSSLVGGVSVDISPYLFHSESIAVINNEIQYCKLILGINRNSNDLYEFDISNTYKVKNQQYSENVSAVFIYDKLNIKSLLNIMI